MAEPLDIPALRARYDEDERIAQESDLNPTWSIDPAGFDGRVWAEGLFVVAERLAEGDAEHIARHDPARVLREVEAKRRIVDWCVEVIGDRDLSNYDRFGSLTSDPNALAVTLAVETLRNLASTYGPQKEGENDG